MSSGINTALDKLAPESYAKSKQLALQHKQSPERNPTAIINLLDITLQRGILFALISSLPILFIWLNAEWILSQCGQSPELSKSAARFVFYMIPALPPALIFDCLKKWRQAVGDSTSGLVTIAVGILINIVLNFCLTLSNNNSNALLFTDPLLGGPISCSITYICLPFIMNEYLRRIKGIPTFSTYYHIMSSTTSINDPNNKYQEWWNMDSLAQWKPYADLALPGAIANLSESGAIQLCYILSALLGEDILNENAYLQMLLHVLFMIPFGIGVVATNRVGALLASHKDGEAKTCAMAGLLLSFGLSGLASFVSLIYFSSTSADNIISSDILPLILVFHVYDSIQTTANSILKVRGDHSYVAYSLSIGYFIVGLPIGAILAFNYGFGLIGIWTGMLLGVIAVAALLLQECYVINAATTKGTICSLNKIS